ncbi:MAG: hypothetical protein IAF02_09055, partial [Anaerolineae bacterium]|nr:hypothetical protein [Anaerolineae bacterium]
LLDEPMIAQLTFYLYPVTGEETAVVPPMPPPQKPLENAEEDTEGDAQYVFLYDGQTEEYLATLYWDLSNAQAWQRHTVDLKAYAGQEIMLYFGAKNDGLNGATGMYIDDVSLLVIDDSLFPYKTYLPIVLKQ